MLCAFWGRNENVGAARWPDYADELIEHGPGFLELTELPEADVAVFPLAGRLLLKHEDGLERARAFADLARGAGKPAVFFYDHSDSLGPFPVEDAIVVRPSLHRTRRTAQEFALPGFHDDLSRQVGGELPVRRRRDRPVVSFCGSVFRDTRAVTVAARARRIAGNARRTMWRLQGRHEEDLFVRAQAVDALGAQDAVDTSIVARDAGDGSAWLTSDDGSWERARAEFVQNVVESDYVLAARGDGNWSVRFYEALSLGRIPVVVDTDLVLPYDFLLPWRDLCVWVDRRDVGTIGEQVLAFHERLSDADFVELQHECRRLWEEYLSPLGFFRNFHLHLAGLEAAVPVHATASATVNDGVPVSASST
jgi:hypothetical protein